MFLQHKFFSLKDAKVSSSLIDITCLVNTKFFSLAGIKIPTLANKIQDRKQHDNLIDFDATKQLYFFALYDTRNGIISNGFCG